MIKDSDNLIPEVTSNGIQEKLTQGQVGLEKEALRIFQSKISNKPHQKFSMFVLKASTFISSTFRNEQPKT